MNLRCAILHLEDEENDVTFFERALQTLGFAGIYRHVAEVGELICYFNGEGCYSDRGAFPMPDILVLDNVMTGSKLMAWMNEHPEVRLVPRVILTGGIPGAEADKWLQAGAKCVLEKGTSLEEMRAAVEKILQLSR